MVDFVSVSLPSKPETVLQGIQGLENFFGNLPHLLQAPQVRLFTGKKGAFSTKCMSFKT
jgi:hypothetical protein